MAARPICFIGPVQSGKTHLISRIMNSNAAEPAGTPHAYKATGPVSRKDATITPAGTLTPLNLTLNEIGGNNFNFLQNAVKTQSIQDYCIVVSDGDPNFKFNLKQYLSLFQDIERKIELRIVVMVNVAQQPSESSIQHDPEIAELSKELFHTDSTSTLAANIKLLRTVYCCSSENNIAEKIFADFNFWPDPRFVILDSVKDFLSDLGPPNLPELPSLSEIKQLPGIGDFLDFIDSAPQPALTNPSPTPGHTADTAPSAASTTASPNTNYPNEQPQPQPQQNAETPEEKDDERPTDNQPVPPKKKSRSLLDYVGPTSTGIKNWFTATLIFATGMILLGAFGNGLPLKIFTGLFFANLALTSIALLACVVTTITWLASPKQKTVDVKEMRNHGAQYLLKGLLSAASVTVFLCVGLGVINNPILKAALDFVINGFNELSTFLGLNLPEAVPLGFAIAGFTLISYLVLDIIFRPWNKIVHDNNLSSQDSCVAALFGLADQNQNEDALAISENENTFTTTPTAPSSPYSHNTDNLSPTADVPSGTNNTTPVTLHN